MKDNLLDGEYLITKEYTNWHIKTGGFARDITLRDHYAGLVLQGFTARSIRATDEELAREAYKMADAMLKERAK